MLAIKYDHYLAVKEEILIIIYEVIVAEGAEITLRYDDHPRSISPFLLMALLLLDAEMNPSFYPNLRSRPYIR